METATALQTIVTADHHINYCGQRIPISSLASTRLYAKFESGGGYGDQSYWCEFHSKYGIYRATKANYGKTLERVGELSETSGTDGSYFHGEIDGKPWKMEGYNVDSIFMKIFENEK